LVHTLTDIPYIHFLSSLLLFFSPLFFFIPPATTDIYTLSLHDALPIYVRPGDALLVVLPIAHNLPLACPGIQGFFLRGARAVLSSSVRAQDVFSLIERERVTHLAVVPALLIRWINDPAIRRYAL